MFRLCCGSRSSANDVRTNNHLAVTTDNGQVVHKHPNSGTGETSLSEAKAQNAAYFQKLLAIQEAKPVSSKTTRWSDHSYDSGQIQLLRDAVAHLYGFWEALHAALLMKNIAPNEGLDAFLKPRVEGYGKEVAGMRQAAASVDKINEPLKSAYAILEAASLAYADTNYLQLQKAALDPKIGCFFKRENFDPDGVIVFHIHLLDMVSGKIPPLETDNPVFKDPLNQVEPTKPRDSLLLCLSEMSRDYLEREIVSKQIPEVEKEFNRIKKTLSKEFVMIFEEIIKLTKISLKNMELPAVKKIMEQMEPAARSKIYTDTIKKMIGIPIEVQNDYLAELMLVNPALR